MPLCLAMREHELQHRLEACMLLLLLLLLQGLCKTALASEMPGQLVDECSYGGGM